MQNNVSVHCWEGDGLDCTSQTIKRFPKAWEVSRGLDAVHGHSFNICLSPGMCLEMRMTKKEVNPTPAPLVSLENSYIWATIQPKLIFLICLFQTLVHTYQCQVDLFSSFDKFGTNAKLAKTSPLLHLRQSGLIAPLERFGLSFNPVSVSEGMQVMKAMEDTEICQTRSFSTKPYWMKHFRVIIPNNQDIWVKIY